MIRQIYRKESYDHQRVFIKCFFHFENILALGYTASLCKKEHVLKWSLYLKTKVVRHGNRYKHNGKQSDSVYIFLIRNMVSGKKKYSCQKLEIIKSDWGQILRILYLNINKSQKDNIKWIRKRDDNNNKNKITIIIILLSFFIPCYLRSSQV
jgi:hypothetical protein